MTILRTTIDRVEICAALTPLHSKSAFNRAHLILRIDNEQALEIRTYLANGQVEGPALTRDDLEALRASEQIIDLPSTVTALPPGTVLWVLRRKLPRRDQALATLRNRGVLLAEPLAFGDDHACLVVENADSEDLRDRWSREALDAARNALSKRNFQGAVTEAEIANAIGRSLDAAVLATLAVAYAHVGRDARATGLIEMARRSRGEAFAEHVQEEVTRMNDAMARTPRRSHPSLARKLERAGFPGVGTPRTARLHDEISTSP